MTPTNNGGGGNGSSDGEIVDVKNEKSEEDKGQTPLKEEKEKMALHFEVSFENIVSDDELVSIRIAYTRN